MKARKKAAIVLGEIGDKKLSEITASRLLAAMPYIDTVPLPEGDLGVVRVKELFDPKWWRFWKNEKKKLEAREVDPVLRDFYEDSLTRIITDFESRLTEVEKRLKPR